MKHRKALRTLAALAVLAALAGAAMLAGRLRGGAQTARRDLKIGVSLYRSNDIFVSSVVAAVETSAKAYEQQNGVKVTLDISSAKENQRTQNEQIKRYIALHYDVICVNVVDRTNASIIIDDAMEAGIPLVFFNREPVTEDILRGENIYYVGTDARATAVAQGKILADAWEQNQAAIDRNGDGVLQYIMLEGEIGHQDTLIRTQWSVQTLADRGIQMENLYSGTANWDRSQAAALMDRWLPDCGKKLEAVLCNNDEMALGAADALQKRGLSGIQVLGIDGTEAGIQAVHDGLLLGTVDVSGARQGRSIFRLAANLAVSGDPPEDIVLQNQRYIRVPIRQIIK